MNVNLRLSTILAAFALAGAGAVPVQASDGCAEILKGGLFDSSESWDGEVANRSRHTAACAEAREFLSRSSIDSKNVNVVFKAVPIDAGAQNARGRVEHFYKKRCSESSFSEVYEAEHVSRNRTASSVIAASWQRCLERGGLQVGYKVVSAATFSVKLIYNSTGKRLPEGATVRIGVPPASVGTPALLCTETLNEDIPFHGSVAFSCTRSVDEAVSLSINPKGWEAATNLYVPVFAPAAPCCLAETTNLNLEMTTAGDEGDETCENFRLTFSYVDGQGTTQHFNRYVRYRVSDALNKTHYSEFAGLDIAKIVDNTVSVEMVPNRDPPGCNYGRENGVNPYGLARLRISYGSKVLTSWTGDKVTFEGPTRTVQVFTVDQL